MTRFCNVFHISRDSSSECGSPVRLLPCWRARLLCMAMQGSVGSLAHPFDWEWGVQYLLPIKRRYMIGPCVQFIADWLCSESHAWKQRQYGTAAVALKSESSRYRVRTMSLLIRLVKQIPLKQVIAPDLSRLQTNCGSRCRVRYLSSFALDEAGDSQAEIHMWSR